MAVGRRCYLLGWSPASLRIERNSGQPVRNRMTGSDSESCAQRYGLRRCHVRPSDAAGLVLVIVTGAFEDAEDYARNVLLRIVVFGFATANPDPDSLTPRSPNANRRMIRACDKLSYKRLTRRTRSPRGRS